MKKRKQKESSVSHPSKHPTQSSYREKKIHPIIIYPFRHPYNTSDLKALYEGLIKKLRDKPNKYEEPITVMNRQTFYVNTLWIHNDKIKKSFEDFKNNYVKKYSDIQHAWCVDSCQMWLSGFGKAYDKENPGDDVYWIIPGDFNYASDRGAVVLENMLKLPEAIYTHRQDLCLGEINVDINSSKQLIDTYGTYGLLYNWFPHEAKEIRKKTDKPRSEFLAIKHSFLEEVIRERWYAYEQTIVILLKAVIGHKLIDTVNIGDITDLPQGRDTLAAAMQQVERTERMLKLLWREHNQQTAEWAERFKKLDAQSGQIRGAALVILENLLVYP